MRHFHETIVAVEINKYYMLACVYMLARACVHVGTRTRGRVHANPARNAYAPYCDVICVPSVSTPYFSTLSHKRCDFRKKFIEYKMYVFIFSTTLLITFII
jgi:hypothetical protein